MAAVTAANIQKHNSGDQTKVTADLTAVDGTDTWDAPHISQIEDWAFAPTTEVDWGGVISQGNRITFATSTQIAGKVTVYGR